MTGGFFYLIQSGNEMINIQCSKLNVQCSSGAAFIIKTFLVCKPVQTEN